MGRAAEARPVKNHLPVTNVSTEQAQAFCTWLGGRLPTEIEWECAVRGPHDKGFPLPWGKRRTESRTLPHFHGEFFDRRARPRAGRAIGGRRDRRSG